MGEGWGGRQVTRWRSVGVRWGGAPHTWAPSLGETRGEGLCCTKSGRLPLPGNGLKLPGKPLAAVELRLRSLCFWGGEREGQAALQSGQVTGGGA